MKNLKMTQEEKEMLRRLMESDEACKKMSFFKDLNWEVPDPETFTQSEPEPPADE